MIPFGTGAETTAKREAEISWEQAVLVAWGEAMPQQPASYYRREAARARQMAGEVTTQVVKARLLDAAVHYDELATAADRLAAGAGV